MAEKVDIEALVDRMTLEEQVSLLSGADFWTTVPVARLGIPKIKGVGRAERRAWGGVAGGRRQGGLLSCGDLAGAPPGIALAERMGAALGGRPKSKGASVLLAPTVKHPPLRSERPQFRMLFGRSGADLGAGGGLYRWAAEQWRRRHHQAFRGQRIRNRAARPCRRCRRGTLREIYLRLSRRL